MLDQTKSVLTMVREHLECNGFDGLFNIDDECACTTGDLAPCGNISLNCTAGFKSKCNCGDHDWHISPIKESDQ